MSDANINTGSEQESIVIGVAGGTGSGKTTVSNKILDAIGPDRITYLQHDSYYIDQGHLSAKDRAKQNYDHPNILDTPLMVEHLSRLRRGEAVSVPVYDFATHTRAGETQLLSPSPVILVEGILIFADEALRGLMDIRIFVDTDSDIRLIRRLKRDVDERGRTPDSVIRQYLETVRPMHLKFVEPSKRYANLIVPEGGYNRVALEMIISRIESLLADG